MKGYGVYTWKDGQKYSGEYLNDLKHGQGTLEHPTGRVYTGGWENGWQHGEGMYTDSKGTKKRGLWKNGKRIKWLEQPHTTKAKMSIPINFNEGSNSRKSEVKIISPKNAKRVSFELPVESLSHQDILD